MSKSSVLELAKKLVAAIEKEDQKNKVMLKDIPVGGKFNTGIGRFIVLEQKEDCTAVITEDLYREDVEFDGDCADYKKSSLRELCEGEILNEFVAEFGEDNICENEAGLVTVDGQKVFEKLLTKVRPLTFDEARECNDLLVNKDIPDALDGLRDHMESFYQRHGVDGWILKCDIRHFFYEIDHEILKDIVDYFFPDPYTTWLNHTLIDSSENPGLPLGNQAGQVYALLMVHAVDCMVTGELGITEYGRYMDDFYLIHQDKEYLKWCLECIREMLKTLGLELNGKTQIIPFRKGMRYLGFHHYMTADGKYIRKLTGENKRKNKKKFRKLVKDVKAGKLTEEKFYEKYNSWKNHALHGNCIKLVHSMDLYIEELMKEVT